MANEKLIEHLKKCRHFENCSRNLCPLDFELHLTSGRNQDRCRYMRPPRRTKAKDKEFITGGTVMPDAILKFVPQRNLASLNEVSKKRWNEINKEEIQPYDKNQRATD